MNQKDNLASTIFKNISFSQKEIDFINSKFEKITLPKGDILIKPNTCIASQYYILSGCLRSYFINKSGIEYTIQFAINDWWISVYTSLFTK